MSREPEPVMHKTQGAEDFCCVCGIPVQYWETGVCFFRDPEEGAED